jgi:hypothetical protein
VDNHLGGKEHQNASEGSPRTSPPKKVQEIVKSKIAYIQEDTSTDGVQPYSLSLDSIERPNVQFQSTSFTIYRTTLVDREVDSIACTLTWQQHLLDALRCFDKYLEKLQAASNEAGVFAATPRNVDAGDNIICAFLEDTRLGRGIRVLVDVMKEAPQSIEGQSLALSVLYHSLVLLLEVREAQIDYDREEQAAILQEKNQLDSMAKAQRARETKHWGNIRETLVPEKKEISFSTRRVVANPMAKLQLTSLKRTTIGTVLAVLDQDSYGKPKDDHDDPSMKGGKNEVPFSRHVAPPKSKWARDATFDEEEEEEEDTIRLAQGGRALQPHPPLHWLPGTSTSKLEDFRSLGPKQTWKRFGRPMQWAEELLELDVLQLVMAALYNLRDASVQVQAMSVMELFIELNPRTTIQQIMAPIKDFVFFDSSRNPFQSTPMSHHAVRAREEALVARGKLLFPNCISLLLRTAKINGNKFSVQGGVGRLIFALCERGGASVAHHICSYTAFETMLGLPKVEGCGAEFSMGNIKVAASLGRRAGQRRAKKSTSIPSNEEAHVHALRERISEIKQRIRDKFKIKNPGAGQQTPSSSHQHLSSISSFGGQGEATGGIARHRKSKKSAEFSDIYHDGHDGTAAHLLVSMLRRWNLGGERKGLQHTKLYIFQQMAKQDQPHLHDAHRACTRALLCLVDQDHRACLWVRSTPKALAALQHAVAYHARDPFVDKHMTDLSAIEMAESNTSKAETNIRQGRVLAAAKASVVCNSERARNQTMPHPEIALSGGPLVSDIMSDYDPGTSLPSVPPPVCGTRPAKAIFKKSQRLTWHPPKQSTRPQGIDRYAFDRLKFDEEVRERVAGGMHVGIQKKVQPVPLSDTGPIQTGLFSSGYP